MRLKIIVVTADGNETHYYPVAGSIQIIGSTEDGDELFSMGAEQNDRRVDLNIFDDNFKFEPKQMTLTIPGKDNQ